MTSRPSMPGSFKSQITIENGLAKARARPLCPSASMATEKPSDSSTSRIAERIPGSSSIMSTEFFKWFISVNNSGQDNSESSSDIYLGAILELAAMALDNAHGDGKSEARACFLGSEKWIE